MSIQTTKNITREEAEKKYKDILIANFYKIGAISDEELEDLIDEQFYNYRIKYPFNL